MKRIMAWFGYVTDYAYAYAKAEVQAAQRKRQAAEVELEQYKKRIHTLEQDKAALLQQNLEMALRVQELQNEIDAKPQPFSLG